MAAAARAASKRAVEAATAGLRSRGDRLRSAAPPVLQTALAAGAAWWVATLIPGHENPVFAPIAAVVALGTTRASRGRQAVEMIFGVALGIAVASLLVSGVGTGAWQIALVTALAMLTAVVLRRSALFVTQAGVWAILVASLERTGGIGIALDRFVDGCVGGAVALVASQLLFPLDPLATVSAAARPLFADLVRALEDVACALEHVDRDRLRRAIDALQGLDDEVDGLKDALGVGVSTARLAPRRRRSRGRLAPYESAAGRLQIAVHNAQVLAAAASRPVRDERPGHPELVAAVRCLARAVEALRAYVERPDEEHDVRRCALAAARHARSALDDDQSVPTSVIVHQTESMAFDLLRGAGSGEEEVRESIAGAVGRER